MIRLRVLLTLIPLVGSLAGCEALGGLKRDAPVPGALDLACAATTIRSMEGISEVQLIPSESLTYKIAGTKGDAERKPALARIFIVDYRTGARLFHTFMLMNRSPPIDDMESARRMMVKVEEAIGTRCPFAPDPTRYRETCKAPRCSTGD